MYSKTSRLAARLLPLAAVAIVAAASPGLAGVFFEGFEDGTLGAMAPMNLDADLYGLEASDGYRCQYNDPDWFWSNSYDQITDCWVGATEEQVEDFFWHVVDGASGGAEGRSASGQYSVWMGAIWGRGGSSKPWHSPSGGGQGPEEPVLTAPMATLEALVTADPLLIGSGAELSFKHQISLPDYRTVNTSGPGRSADGGVVQAQVVDSAGQPLGPWMTLVAFQNAYDSQREDNYTNCFFDPIDDGNTEDDFYNPEDPMRRLGPSSLCYDQYVFACMGDTDEAYDANNVCNGDEGTGLAGATGIGTWVESRFDLSQYADKHILIRFINNGIKAGTSETYQDLFHWNPTPGDDGWWVDDITVTGVVTDDELDATPQTSAPAGGGLKVLQARPAQ